jgi:hypothetical protein
MNLDFLNLMLIYPILLVPLEEKESLNVPLSHRVGRV